MNLSVLDEQKFHYCCQLLVQQSQQLKDGWCWETVTVSTFLSPISADNIQKSKVFHGC